VLPRYRSPEIPCSSLPGNRSVFGRYDSTFSTTCAIEGEPKAAERVATARPWRSAAALQVGISSQLGQKKAAGERDDRAKRSLLLRKDGVRLMTLLS
jgi:hypothetical protein